MRLLWLTSETPDRNLGGGNIRQANLLVAASHRFDVHLVCPEPVNDPFVSAAAATVTTFPEPPWPIVSTTTRRIKELRWLLADRRPEEQVVGARIRAAAAEAVRSAGTDFDVVHVEHGHLAPLIPTERTFRATLTLQQLASTRARHALAHAPGRRHRLVLQAELKRATAFERSMMARFDSIIVPSDADAAVLGPQAAVVPNGVDVERFTPTAVPTSRTVLVTGTLGYQPNVDGVNWFVNEVWPAVKARVPDAQLQLVGRDPHPDVCRLAGPDVQVHGDVPSTIPYLQACRVAVVPLRIGSGTRLKALEAMASGRPVVGTSIGLEGLAIEDGRHAIVRDDPEAMAIAVADVLLDDRIAAQLGAQGRHAVVTRYSWDAIGPAFVSLLAAS